MNAEPLIAPGGYPLLAPDCVWVARRGGQPIGRARFLSDVAALAERLPEATQVINLCRDRYRFMVGFAAALCRGQASLLPPSDTPGVLAQMAQDHPGIAVLHDGAAPVSDLFCIAYPEDLGAAAVGMPPTPIVPDGQVAAVLYTSGSTGQPQPHARSWGMLVRSARAAGVALGVAELSGASVIGTVPHQHSYGLESLVMLALQHGLVLHAERPFYPADIRALLAAAPAPRILVTAPVHLRVLLDDPADVPPVDLVVSATAPLSPQLARAAEARFGGALHEIYGCSESGQLAARRSVETEEWRCLPGVALRRVGTAIWADAAAGRAPIAVRARLSDIVELRDATRFVLLGRSGDMVNIAGKRTSLAHLGFHLNAIEGVRDGVFVLTGEDGSGVQQNGGQPNGGQQSGGVRRLMAFAVAPGFTAADILAALRLRIDPAFLPRPLHIVEILPRNDVGKLSAATVNDLLARAGRA